MKYCVTERKTFIVPSVTMKGGMPPSATSTPLRAPSRAPKRMTRTKAMMKASHPVICICVSQPAAELSVSRRKRAPVMASVEPTARSIPPEMMMNAMPRETMPTDALLRRTLIQLTQKDVHHAPKELKSVPKASVWRMIMTSRASVVLNSGLVFHCVLNHLRNFMSCR